MMFHVKDREIVSPGQLLGADVRHDMNCYTEGSQVYSLVKGLARIDGESITVIPARGGYTPKADDTVIGIVTDSNSAGWVIDINTAYSCFLRKDETEGPRRDGGRDRRGGGRRGPPMRGRDFRDDHGPHEEVKLAIGDIISAKVLSVDEVYNANLTRPWNLSDGMMLSMNPKRIPRLIGKKQSMLSMIKEKTGCKIVTGQNGLGGVKGEQAVLVAEVVQKIELEAEIPGLTDRVSALLDERRNQVHELMKNEEHERY
ncbi:MAG: KH domain-containing protein [Candidatus Altiarchaeota archaeon]|nr:KH domain-containing protein [Candidatus Altiarchaeota archaeon]